MTKHSVYVVDDDASFRSYVATMLAEKGYEAAGIETGNDLIVKLKASSIPSVILLDVLLPDSDGIQVMAKIKEMGIAAPVIMLSGIGQVRTVVEAMKLGATDFLMKPFEPAALEDAIEKALELLSENTTLRRPAVRSVDGSSGFVTGNPEMQRLAEIVCRVADTDVPILITGESGSGKEVMARHAHLNSSRRDRPFIKVNCAAMPHELLESELFGYEKGAFTGAVGDKPGKFELAHGGTLLLDEIGDMSALLQAKLLHVLQDGTFCRLGARKDVRVDVRVIAATNINIEEAVAKGKFREDLYFRLNVIRVDLPPLRKRREDIPALCDYFMSKYGKRYNPNAQLPDDLLNAFINYPWPGNIRQLENYIRRFLVLPNDNSLMQEMQKLLPKEQIATAVSVPAGNTESLLEVAARAAERAERELVRRVLEETGGNRKMAARRLNICYKALLNKLKRWSGPQTFATPGGPAA
jgi:two-component system response regulator AtoC